MNREQDTLNTLKEISEEPEQDTLNTLKEISEEPEQDELSDIQKEQEEILIVKKIKKLSQRAVDAYKTYRDLSGKVSSTVNEEILRLQGLVEALKPLSQYAGESESMGKAAESMSKIHKKTSVSLEDNTSEFNIVEEEEHDEDQENLREFLKTTDKNKLEQEKAKLDKLITHYQTFRDKIDQIKIDPDKSDQKNKVNISVQAADIIVDKYDILAALQSASQIQNDITGDFKKFYPIILNTVKNSCAQYLARFKDPNNSHSHQWAAKLLQAMAEYFLKQDPAQIRAEEFGIFMHIFSESMKKLPPNSTFYQMMVETMKNELGVIDILRTFQEMETLQRLSFYSLKSFFEDVKELLSSINKPINWRDINNAGLFGLDITIAISEETRGNNKQDVVLTVTSSAADSNPLELNMNKNNEKVKSHSNILVTDTSIKIQSFGALQEKFFKINKIDIESIHKSKFNFIQGCLFLILDLETKTGDRDNRHSILNELLIIGKTLLSKDSVKECWDYLLTFNGGRSDMWFRSFIRKSYNEYLALPKTKNSNLKQELDRLLERDAAIETILHRKLGPDQIMELLQFIMMMPAVTITLSSHLKNMFFSPSDIVDHDKKENLLTPTQIKEMQSDKKELNELIVFYKTLGEEINKVMTSTYSQAGQLQETVCWLIVELKYDLINLLKIFKDIDSNKSKNMLSFFNLFTTSIQRFCKDYLAKFPKSSISHSHQWSTELLQTLTDKFAEINLKNSSLTQSHLAKIGLEFSFLLSTFVQFVKALGSHSSLKQDLINFLSEEIGLSDFIRAQREYANLRKEIKADFRRDFKEVISLNDANIRDLIEGTLTTLDSKPLNAENLEFALNLNIIVSYTENAKENRVENQNIVSTTCTLSIKNPDMKITRDNKEEPAEMKFTLQSDLDTNQSMDQLFNKSDIKIMGINLLPNHFYQLFKGGLDQNIEKGMKTSNLFYIQTLLSKIVELEIIRTFNPVSTENRHQALGVLLKIGKELAKKETVDECREYLETGISHHDMTILRDGIQGIDNFFDNMKGKKGEQEKKTEEVISI